MARQTIIRIAVPVLGTLALSACATPFQAEVSRFERLPDTMEGQSFTITADDPKLANSIEFASYAEIVAAKMSELGYVRAASPDTADLVVAFDYDVDKGEERVVRDYDPFYRGYGYWGDPYYGYYPRYRYIRGWYDPFMFDNGYNVRSYTVYTSELDLTIERAADDARLFEGKAQARSRDNQLTYLVPNLIQAMFTDFPGNNGETVKITIKQEKDAD